VKKEFLGDSYDLVKRFLIDTLRTVGTWAVHPMLTEPEGVFGPAEVAQYETLLGARIISRGVLGRNGDREADIRCCMDHEGPLLLDPNTGFKSGHSRSVDHLHQADLVPIVNDRLVMIYDQGRSRSLNREGVERDLREKLRGLLAADLRGMAYRPHTCFLFASRHAQVIEEARALLLGAGLPECRLISAGV
jgi:hypothetical protein